MKKFMIELGKEMIKGGISAIILVPMTIVGINIGGYIWKEKIKPKIKKEK